MYDDKIIFTEGNGVLAWAISIVLTYDKMRTTEDISSLREINDFTVAKHIVHDN